MDEVGIVSNLHGSAVIYPCVSFVGTYDGSRLIGESLKFGRQPGNNLQCKVADLLRGAGGPNGRLGLSHRLTDELAALPDV